MSIRRTVTIPIFAFGADPKAVAQAVRDHGFVVVEAMRTEAKRIFAEVRSLLGIDLALEEPPYLHHAASPVADRGWVDYFIHSDVFDDLYSQRIELLAAAMRVWLAAGQPDHCVARVALPNRPTLIPSSSMMLETSMPRVDLKVPFEQKDEAKASGARWDAVMRCWYVPEGVDAAPFSGWRTDRDNTMASANVRADRFGVAVSETSCWKCDVLTPVACLVVDAFHEEADCDDEDDVEVWQVTGYPSALGTVTSISQPALSQALAVAPWLKMSYSKTVGGTYLGNLCGGCGALQGDFFLHCEPGGAFFPMDDQERSRIRIHWFDVPLQAGAGQIGIDSDWVE